MTTKRSHAHAERIREARRLGVGLGLGLGVGLGMRLGMTLALAWAPAGIAVGQEPADREPGDWQRHHVEGDVAATPEAVCSTLSDLEAFPRWFPGIREWRLLDPERRDPREGPVPVYGRQHGFGPVRDRDYVVHYHLRSGADGACSLEARALAEAGPAPDTDAVRIDSMRTVWSVRVHESYGSHARVGYTVHIAPGWIPEWATPERLQVAPELLIERLAAEVRRRDGR